MLADTSHQPKNSGEFLMAMDEASTGSYLGEGHDNWYDDIQARGLGANGRDGAAKPRV